jgi:hypothetical protein
MDLIFPALSVASSLIAQACCWWHCFKCCGWIEDDQQQLRTQDPRVVIDTRQINNKNPNPFLNPHAPRDAHLEPVYH